MEIAVECLADFFESMLRTLQAATKLHFNRPFRHAEIVRNLLDFIRYYYQRPAWATGGNLQEGTPTTSSIKRFNFLSAFNLRHGFHEAATACRSGLESGCAAALCNPANEFGCFRCASLTVEKICRVAIPRSSSARFPDKYHQKITVDIQRNGEPIGFLGDIVDDGNAGGTRGSVEVDHIFVSGPRGIRKPALVKDTGKLFPSAE